MANREHQGPLAEALRPLAATLRQHRSNIRPVSQVIVTLGSSEKKDAFEVARKSCLQWLKNRAGRRLPDIAWEGKTFELEEVGAQRVGAVGIESPRYWAARLDDADRKVAQRTWVTEIGLGQADEGKVLFGVRLICVTRGEDEEYERTVPGFVRSIIELNGATIDGRPLLKDPWIVHSEEDVKALVRLLRHPGREADVIAFALPEGSTDPNETAASAFDVHRATLGAAHVVIVTGPASYYLSDRVGREFSVFNQGVRTYLAGFNPNQEQPFRHPLGLPDRIAEWPNGGPDAYARMLISYALARSVAKPDRESRLPSFATIRRYSAKQHLDEAKLSGSSNEDMLALALADNEHLRKELDEAKRNSDQLLQHADEEREQALQEAQQASARADTLRRYVETLEARLESVGESATDIPIPETLEDFEDWCHRYLTGHVDLHNRAYQGVKRSEYQADKFLYQSLLLLRNFYVPMRRKPSDGAKQAYEAECYRLGLEESGTITDSRLGEQGDTYIVNYAGRKRTLDRHLKHGTSKDQRFCFRLYFFWDESSEQVVVGWLPSHLDTRQT